jgi:ubiquinone/menaquinone biosynthesis C-methylase UbiE
MSTSELELSLVDQAYDSPSWWYDLRGLLILTFSYRSHLARQVRFFGSNMGEAHLEGAAGSGSLLDIILRWRRFVGRTGSRIVAFDYAEAMLAGARKRFAKARDVEVLRADATRLPFADASFDTVNIANAVHCFADIDGAFREAHRVLAAGGTLAINVLLTPRGGRLARAIAAAINAWGMKKGILFRPYEEDEVFARLERAGLRILAARVHGNALEVLAQKESA